MFGRYAKMLRMVMDAYQDKTLVGEVLRNAIECAMHDVAWYDYEIEIDGNNLTAENARAEDAIEELNTMGIDAEPVWETNYDRNENPVEVIRWIRVSW